MNRGQVLFFAGALIAVLGALVLAIALQPEQPNLAGDSGYQEQSASYRAGGSDCEPAKIGALPVGLRQGKADACAEAQEQHREAANNLIENRRAAVAAEAGAVAGAAQARIEAWGAGIGLLTLFAALAAAIFAERAAFHTKAGANAAEKSLASQERVAAAELRPWVNIEIALTKFSASEDLISIHYELVFSNVGKTVANHFNFKSDTDWVRTLDPKVFDSKFAEWPEPTELDRFAIMPGEKKRYFGSHSTIKRILPWTDRNPKVVSYILVATAFYRSPIDDRWHRTDRGFTVGDKDGSSTAGFFIPKDLIGDDPDLLTVRPAYSGETS